MTETKIDYSIGHLRIKYLDMANISFAQNTENNSNYIAANGHIDSFVDTIKEESKAGKAIKDEFDKITLMKRQVLTNLSESIKDLSYLEKNDIKNRGREEIEINAIHDKKEACWRIAMKEGLFNE